MRRQIEGHAATGAGASRWSSIGSGCRKVARGLGACCVGALFDLICACFCMFLHGFGLFWGSTMANLRHGEGFSW